MQWEVVYWCFSLDIKYYGPLINPKIKAMGNYNIVLAKKTNQLWSKFRLCIVLPKLKAMSLIIIMLSLVFPFGYVKFYAMGQML